MNLQLVNISTDWVSLRKEIEININLNIELNTEFNLMKWLKASMKLFKAQLEKHKTTNSQNRS